mmetsp:Transcript_28047/g.62116  ORF Transcript_28047/g.62116 Transcript_28047/m.62116 type:complete len:282 (+) Transcript_28047:1440-2285(+)
MGMDCVVVLPSVPHRQHAEKAALHVHPLHPALLPLLLPASHPGHFVLRVPVRGGDHLHIAGRELLDGQHHPHRQHQHTIQAADAAVRKDALPVRVRLHPGIFVPARLSDGEPLGPHGLPLRHIRHLPAGARSARAQPQSHHSLHAAQPLLSADPDEPTGQRQGRRVLCGRGALSEKRGLPGLLRPPGPGVAVWLRGGHAAGQGGLRAGGPHLQQGPRGVLLRGQRDQHRQTGGRIQGHSEQEADGRQPAVHAAGSGLQCAHHRHPRWARRPQHQGHRRRRG